MDRSVRLRNKTSNNLRMKASSLYFLNDISSIDSNDNSTASLNWRDGYTFNPMIIGRGHFSKVYKVKCCATGNTVAIKVIRRKRLGTDKIDDIMQEIEIMQLINKSCNPGFIQLLKVHTSPSEVGIVMEYASGGSLYHVVQDSRTGLPEVYVRIVLTKLLSALSVIHHQDIVHLDIKADNILLRYHYPSTDIVLTDFGLARKLTKSKVLKEMVGTPDYIAPEVANYERISLASDLWSVGVLTYVLLTNVSPFTGDSKDDTLRRVTKAEFEFVGKLKEESMYTGRTFINNLIIRTPEDRLSADECLSHNFLSNVPIVECLPDKSYFAEAPIISLDYQVKVRQNCSYNTRGLVMSQYDIDSSYLIHDDNSSQINSTECLNVSIKYDEYITSNMDASLHSIDQINEELNENDQVIQEATPECFYNEAEKVKEMIDDANSGIMCKRALVAPLCIDEYDEEVSEMITDVKACMEGNQNTEDIHLSDLGEAENSLNEVMTINDISQQESVEISPEAANNKSIHENEHLDVTIDVNDETNNCHIFRTEIYDSRRRLNNEKKTKGDFDNISNVAEFHAKEEEIDPNYGFNTEESQEINSKISLVLVGNKTDTLKSVNGVVKRRSLTRSIKRNSDKINATKHRSVDISQLYDRAVNVGSQVKGDSFFKKRNSKFIKDKDLGSRKSKSSCTIS